MRGATRAATKVVGNLIPKRDRDARDQESPETEIEIVRHKRRKQDGILDLGHAWGCHDRQKHLTRHQNRSERESLTRGGRHPEGDERDKADCHQREHEAARVVLIGPLHGERDLDRAECGLIRIKFGTQLHSCRCSEFHLSRAWVGGEAGTSDPGILLYCEVSRGLTPRPKLEPTCWLIEREILRRKITRHLNGPET